MSPPEPLEAVELDWRRGFLRLATEDILAFGFIILCIGTAIVAIIIAAAMSFGAIDAVVGGSILGGLLGGDVLIGLVGKTLRREKQTAASVEAEDNPQTE